MTERTIVIRKNSCTWQPNTKRKIIASPKVAAKISIKHAAGFVSPVLVVFACTAFAGLFYIYSVNQTAVKGIAIRNAEKEIARQKKENESLKIKEAELKSLYHIEESSKQLKMAPATTVKYIEEVPSIALGK